MGALLVPCVLPISSAVWHFFFRASQMVLRVNNPSANAREETWVRSLDREDPLEEGMATHSSTLPWRIPWTEEPGELQSIGLQRVRHN